MSIQASEKKMWDGRFESGMAPSMIDLSFSLHVDQALIEEDIAGSLAHGKGLVESGVFSAEEYEKIAVALRGILEDYRAGKALWQAGDEDVHMAVERLLTERVGDLGKKIHTGRSRNDQVATDFKLYMRRRAAEIKNLVLELQTEILKLAETHFGKLMPGYTHVQQAQPILFSHYLMSFFFVLSRDVKRFQNFLEIHNELPLGSGAMAGSAFPYQRNLVAEELGFAFPSANSIDAVSHRDMALEFTSNLAIIASTLSRYAEDLVNWSTSEFGFVTLSDAFSSGSSMMPQKKNPDSMELIRGKSGRMLGNFTALFTLVKGAPLSYSRDLQEDKEPVFDSVRTVKVCLQVMKEALATARWNFETMERKMLPALLATDLADFLVESGVPFRNAHHIVGSLVGEAAKQGREFTELSDEVWEKTGVPNPKAVKAKLTFEYSVGKRNIEGGTGPDSVKQQFEKAKALLKKN
ncbi:MAG: argininosuccinate lyase [Fibrobacter sp.]|jgi:argininosuccinate lyase|nr:argininosuccinate lyase [Fibrobacter sp.]